MGKKVCRRGNGAVKSVPKRQRCRKNCAEKDIVGKKLWESALWEKVRGKAPCGIGVCGKAPCACAVAVTPRNTASRARQIIMRPPFVEGGSTMHRTQRSGKPQLQVRRCHRHAAAATLRDVGSLPFCSLIVALDALRFTTQRSCWLIRARKP